MFAVDQSSKDIGTAAHIIKPAQSCLISIAPGLCKGLYYIKGFLVDDGLMSILDDFPFRLRREYLRRSKPTGNARFASIQIFSISYKKAVKYEISQLFMVDLKGFEPSTSRMRTERSPS